MLFLTTSGSAQSKKKNLVHVDAQGVMRYSQGGAEAAFFGVNYTTPFAHAYRAQLAKGLNLEECIRQDVYHFSRLGLNAFRVHVWDTEISDTAGNLLHNEHLRLFDFLLAELKKYHIRTIITPIAFWGNGYPEPDEATPGFSRFFGRGRLTSNDTAIRAQENYLRQFFRHRNPYTGLSYQEDKDIIAVEINNEPSHSDPKSEVTRYINRLASAIRATGWNKPVFYNIAQGPYFSDAVAAANIDGFSFQWYPTGLVGNRTLRGNSLPLVDRYRIPFADTVPAFRRRALMVYEFDAADVMGSYMYPMMAKSFRQAGFQWATQFAYDPMGMADVNTEYQTHYLNLAYTPSKAISLQIAAEVFRQIPRASEWGPYPADSTFDVFTSSYQRGLSEMNSDEKFIYSASTETRPLDPDHLKLVAGVGSSPLVQYGGTGAYFLDRLDTGIWRLELMPDAIPIRDPFERASPSKKVTVIEWNTHSIQLDLPGLGDRFEVHRVDSTMPPLVTNHGSWQASPGIYLLYTRGDSTGKKMLQTTLSSRPTLIAPPPSEPAMLLRHDPPAVATEGRSLIIRALVAGWKEGHATVQVTRKGGGFWRQQEMKKEGEYLSATLPADWIATGQLQYRIVWEQEGRVKVYPGGTTGQPYAWDQPASNWYEVTVRKSEAPLVLFDPSDDEFLQVAPNWRKGFESRYVSGETSHDLVYQLSIQQPQPGEVIAMQTYIGDRLDFSVAAPATIAVRIRADSAVSVKLGLLNKWGSGYSAEMKVNEQWQTIRVPLAALQPDSAILLPRPYPGFQPLYFQSGAVKRTLQLAELEKLQISALPGAAYQQLTLELGRVWLEWDRR